MPKFKFYDEVAKVWIAFDSMDADTLDGRHYSDILSLIENRVVIVAGKGLSTNDYTSAEKTKLAGVATNANNYVLPASLAASIITESTTRRFVTDTEKALWNGKSSFSGSYADLTNKPTIPAAVVLNDTVTSTSTTQAATARAVKEAFDNANASLNKSGGTMTGVLTANSNTSHTVRQVHNMILSDLDANLAAMQNGDIWIKYK